MSTVVDNENQCQSCGKIYEHPVRYHSGTRECQPCWDWRKMNGPMARYWNERVEKLFDQGPDLWDLETWKRMGIQTEMIEALNTLEAFRTRCEIAIYTDGNDRRLALGYTEIKED